MSVEVESVVSRGRVRCQSRSSPLSVEVESVVSRGRGRCQSRSRPLSVEVEAVVSRGRGRGRCQSRSRSIEVLESRDYSWSPFTGLGIAYETLSAATISLVETVLHQHQSELGLHRRAETLETGAVHGSHDGSAPIQPPFSPHSAPFSPIQPHSAPFSPHSSPFSPHSAPIQPPFSSHSAPIQPPFSPHSAPIQPPFSPHSAPIQPPFTYSIFTLLTLLSRYYFACSLPTHISRSSFFNEYII